MTSTYRIESHINRAVDEHSIMNTMYPPSNGVDTSKEGTHMKHVISCTSLFVAVAIVAGLGGITGCEGSDTTDVSGNIRQHDNSAPKVDPNAMPGQGDGLESQGG